MNDRLAVPRERASVRFSRIMVPALMFQAVAIGGAYATGREIIEFGASYGALGWAAGAAMAVMGAVLGYLVYETARKHRLFDYRSMSRHLIGRFFWLFDVVYIPFALTVLAVLCAATGDILRDTLGLDTWVGVGAIISITAVVIFKGTRVIERFNGIGTILLMLGYVFFSLLVIVTHWDNITTVFANGDHRLKPDASLGNAVLLGAIYVGLGFVIYPSTLMTVRHLRTRTDTAIAAAFTGGLYVVPWFLTYFALMGFYPSGRIFDAPVPWLTMLTTEPRWVVVLYGILVGWTLVATAVGLIESVLVRIDQNVIESTGHAIAPKLRVLITLGALLFSAILARFGIIDLISTGYLVGAIALIAVFGIPLVIKGAQYFLPRSNSKSTDSEEQA